VQDGTRLAGPAGFGPDGFTSAALPLASIGRAVGWRIPPDDFRVFVPQAAAGRSIALEVFSPEVNRNDYANQRDRRTYYGDELYGKTATLTTNFNFRSAQGLTLVNRTFGESLRHSYERLAQQNLEPGFYPLTVTSEGNGKNSFALRVTNGARIESSQFTVTARGSFNQDQVVGFVQIDPSQLGKTVKLENYDADGPTEIVLTLVGPDGKRYPLTASGDTQWATNSFVVNRALVGTWKILARILPTTRQFSNSFAVRLRVDDQPLYAQLPGFGIRTQPLQPIRCEVVDTTGALIPGATCTTTGAATRTLRPNLPECYTPVSARILEGTGTVVSPTQVNITSQSGAVRFVATCPPARVQVNAFALVCGARTPVPAAGFSVSGGAPATGIAPSTVNVQPGSVTITPTAIAGSTAQPVTVTAVRGQTVVANLEYTVQTALEVAPSALSLEVGGTATVTVRASTAFTSAVPVTINVTLPQGLETSAPLRISGTVASGRPLQLSIPVRATAPVAGGAVRATLEPNCGVSATAAVTVTAPPPPPAPPTPPAPPPPAPPTPPPPTPPAPDPAKLTLTKTVNRDLLRPGEVATYTLTVTNTGGTAARNITLNDSLPAGLRGDAVAQTFDLEPGASKVVTVSATVADDASGTLTNTARVTWSGDPLQASAQVRVQPVVDLAVTKSVTPSSVQVGEGATYTMTVTNNGPSTATNVTLTDPLPTGLTYVSSTASQGTATFANNTVSAQLGTLARGARATVTVRVSAPTVGRYTNTATVAAAETETTLENNRANAVLEVRAAPPPPPTPLGTLQVTSSAAVCGTTSALSGTGFTVNGTRYTAPASVQLAPGTYTVQPDAVPGSSAQPVSVTVTSNQTTTANLAYAVQLALKLQPESTNLRAGETRTLTATASTAFPYPVATSITLSVPAPLTVIRGPTTVSGAVSANAPLVAVVTVRALENASAVVVSASLPASCNITDSATLSITPAALPEQRRESQVVLLAQVQQPTVGKALILSDRIPGGATYVRGSSQLVTNPTFDVNTPTSAPGTAIADPYQSGDRLFWVIPVRPGSSTTAALREAAARGQITMTRNAQGQTVYGVTYRLAHAGALVMPQDRVAVIAIVPARPANTARTVPTVDPQSTLGRLTGPGELQVLQGDPSILTDLARAVPYTGSSATGRPVGGPATRLVVRAERATTDSIDQPTIVVEAFDRDGLPANDAFATLQTNVDLVDRDANPLEPGYQVALTGGIGRARVQNLSGGVANQSSSPVTEIRVEARITNSNGVITSSNAFRVNEISSAVAAPNPLQPSSTPTTAVDRPVVAVGTLSVGGALDFSTGVFSLDAGLRFALRGSIAPGTTLTLGINWQAAILPTFALSGTLNPPANPFERFPLLGDSSDLGSDIRSSAGFYGKLEFGSSYVLYGDFNPAFRGVLSSYNANFTGLQALLRGDGYGLSVFATDAPLANLRFTRQADGTDLYFLRTAVNPSSERVVITTYQLPIGFTSPADLCTVGERIKLESRLLARDADYTIDYATGIVRLRQALTARDPNGNINCVEIDYASTNPAPDFRFGAQASIGSNDGFSFTATALQFRNGTFGGNSSILLGAGLRYSGGGFDLALEAANSGVFGAGDWAGAASLAYTGSGFGVRLNYQNRGIGFVNPETNTVQSGQNLTAGFLIGDPNGFRLTAGGEYTQSYTPTGNPSSLSLSAEARNNFGPFTAGLGLAYQQTLGSSSNALLATAGLEVPLGFASLSVLQRVPVIGGPTDYGDTTIALSIPLSRAFSVRLSDKLTYEWNGIRQQLSFGVSGAFSNSELVRTLTGNEALVPDAFGQTNVSADYQLDTVNGNAGRARVGFETTIPLSSAFSLQLGGEAVFSPNASEPRGSFTVGGLYRDSSTQGGLRAQFSVLPGGLKQVYTAQIIAELSPEFVVSPAVEYAVDPSAWSTPGARFADGGYFSIAFAYRGNNLSILSNNTGKFGLYSATGDKVEGEIQLGYQSSEVLYFRSGLAYRYLFGGTFTAQFTAGLQYFLSDSFAIGAQGALQLQPATGFFGYAFGLEGGFRVADNLLFTIGFNFVGLNNSLSGSFSPGLYFRLDWKIDERTFGIRP
jgi:uncharacterized repeat protein (TIGR01451 family)